MKAICAREATFPFPCYAQLTQKPDNKLSAIIALVSLISQISF